MKTLGLVDVFDKGEVETRKASGEITLEDVKVMGMNLIDHQQVYISIQEEDGRITSTIVDYAELLSAVQTLITEVEKLERKEKDGH